MTHAISIPGVSVVWLVSLILLYPPYTATAEKIWGKRLFDHYNGHTVLDGDTQSHPSSKFPRLRGGIPALIHQSWKDENIPPIFQNWPDSWRTHHSEWQYHLWTDEDNRALIQYKYPWFFKTYDALQGVMQADFARLFYMHRFGGVYVDLDFECMRSMTTLLSDQQGAVLARMGSDTTYDNSIPNAWMASTPGHGFWLFAAFQIQQRLHWHARVEYKTGPGVLYDALNAWQRLEGVEPVVLLEPGIIYPFQWGHSPEVCHPNDPAFDPAACKQFFPGTHTWEPPRRDD